MELMFFEKNFKEEYISKKLRILAPDLMLILLKYNFIDNDKLRIETAFSIFNEYNIVPEVKRKSKDLNESIDLRNQANVKFISCRNVEKLAEVCELYSKSIAMAPNMSEELSLAYANRSAPLFEMRKYNECLADIDRALMLNYPNRLKGKLLCRKIKCLNALKKVSDAKDVIDELQEWLKNSNLSEDDTEKVRMQCKNLTITENSASIIEEEIIINDLPTFTPHKKIPSFSNAITLKCNEKFGRHVVANRKIKMGEILVKEQIYFKALPLKDCYTHCSHCLSLHWAMIPCEFCVNAMYCSEKCKNEAWKKYHDIECAVTSYLSDFDWKMLFSIKIAILALREAGSMNLLREYLNKIDNFNNPEKGFDKELFHGDTYKFIYILAKKEKRSCEIHFVFVVYVVYILYYLCSVTTLFGKKLKFDLDKMSQNLDVIFFGEIILQNIQIITINTYKLSTGYSIQPFGSLFNHNCFANASGFTKNKDVIIFATLPIEEGSQIYVNYLFDNIILKMPKSRRQELLLNAFDFHCECIACKNNWSLLNVKPYIENVFKEKVEDTNKVMRAIQDYHRIQRKLLTNSIESKTEALEDVAKMIDVFINSGAFPFLEFLDALEIYKCIFKLIYADN